MCRVGSAAGVALSAAFCLTVAGVAPAARGQVYISEVLGSTAGPDAEFIELTNPTTREIDLTGWTIELWDSDAGPTFGTPDADSPIRLRGVIDGGGCYLLANARFLEVFRPPPGAASPPIRPDQPLRADAIENSSYTLVLRDNLGEIVETVFFPDGDGDEDAANINGQPITPGVTIRPEGPGRFIAPGFARLDAPDGTKRYIVLPFSPLPTPGATPGVPNPQLASPGEPTNTQPGDDDGERTVDDGRTGDGDPVPEPDADRP